MNSLFFLCASACVAASLAAFVQPGDEAKLLNSAAISKHVNDMKTTWTAVSSEKFKNSTVANFKRYLGTILKGEKGYIQTELERSVFKVSDSDIPSSFDARTYFSKCTNIIGHVRDQSSCG